MVPLLVAVGADVDRREPVLSASPDGDGVNVSIPARSPQHQLLHTCTIAVTPMGGGVITELCGTHFTWPARLWFITREPLLHDSSFLLLVLQYELQ